MKSITRLRAISIILLICLCWQVIPAQCAEIFFNYSTGNRLLIDLTFVKKDAADKNNRLTLCDKDRTLLESQTVLLEQKIGGLTLDKEAYRKESDKFQELYVTADKARIDAVNDAPSRLRWFGAGVLAVLIAGIAGAMAFK